MKKQITFSLFLIAILLLSTGASALSGTNYQVEGGTLSGGAISLPVLGNGLEVSPPGELTVCWDPQRPIYGAAAAAAHICPASCAKNEVGPATDSGQGMRAVMAA